jgi:signal transduction histidine kinase/ActR/RegA family two-component response regulator
MENPVNTYDASTWIGRVSVHQDFFWFFSLLVWVLALIVWWRHPERRKAWAWLPGAGGVAVVTALVQFGLFNPTFDFFQDRLIPGTVSAYVPAVVDPYWLGDVLMGAALAAMAAGWGWLAARRSGRAHLRWLPALFMGGVAALHVADPITGGVLLVVAAAIFARTLRAQVVPVTASLCALLVAALLPVFSTVGPLAAALHALQRSGPPTPIGLGTAIFQLLLGVMVLLSLRRGLVERLPAETLPAFRRDSVVFWLLSAMLLLAGISWGVQTGRDNRREIQQNRLRTTAAHARVFDPALLAPLHRPEFKIDWRDTDGETTPARSRWLASGVAEDARRRLSEVVIATPFLDHARVLVIHDGWLVAALSSEDQARPGEIEVLRRATPADLAQWERKEPYVEESPVKEIGYPYYCRAPIVAEDGRMLGWLDCVRREYYLSVERRWRAAPFLMTALGVGLLGLVFAQRQIGREREIALRSAAVSAEGNRIKMAFLANVSHELRTPLQSILGYTELLTPALNDDKSRARLDALRQQGELMTRLVNDLIDLSAVEAGSFQLSPAPVAPAELAREVVEGLRPRAEGKGLAIQTQVDGNVPAWITADGARLRQVLTNLVGNAVKFTDHGSVTVSVRAETDEDGAVALSIAVWDTGPGIPPTQQSRLFNAFSRLEHTAAKEGSGLGLALSAAICRAMGGDITVESDGVNGSCFTASVRVTPGAAPAMPAAAAAARAGFTPRVLVVDDNRLVRELFVSSLGERGARCRAAASGAEGLALIAAEKPDVVVLDLALPDGDGSDFVPQFRAKAPGIRIIGVSAHAGADDKARALAAGMDAFLVKPVSLDALWAALAGSSPAATATPVFFDLPPALRDRLRAEFVHELPARRGELSAAVQATDWARVRSAAHYLRNSALVVQAGTLFEACTSLEAAASAGDGRAVAEAWKHCRAALDSMAAP